MPHAPRSASPMLNTAVTITHNGPQGTTWVPAKPALEQEDLVCLDRMGAVPAVVGRCILPPPPPGLFDGRAKGSCGADDADISEASDTHRQDRGGGGHTQVTKRKGGGPQWFRFASPQLAPTAPRSSLLPVQCNGSLFSVIAVRVFNGWG